MKDTEFLELLNLYLDHEISAADAARLEAEVQVNPDRRRVYQEYCRMQKACTLLAKDFVDQPADRKVIAFEPRRAAWSPGLFAVGGLAVAAACVALVLVKRAPSGETNAPVQAQKFAVVEQSQVAAPAPTAADVTTQISHTVTVPVRRGESHAMLAAMPLTLANSNAANPDTLVVSSPQTPPAQFEWMSNIQLTPIQQLQAEQLRLDARSPLQPASRRAFQGNVEMTAFKFSK